ncbi:hypothetical protein MBTS_07975 [Methylobacterium bullatum]|nr:hypothetical protein [Methylobacterium bullatum]
MDREDQADRGIIAQRSDVIPKIIGEEWFGHAKPTLDIQRGAIRRGALSSVRWWRPAVAS